MTTMAARSAAEQGLVLRPMRPLTYRTGVDRALEAVTMPPVEVWDDAAARTLAASRPDHVLHLVAPEPTGAEGPPSGAASTVPRPDTGGTLNRWLSAGVVVRAGFGALYLWSWEVAGRRVRGVVGAVDLPAGPQLVPHERVRADVVATRAAQLGAAAVQAEPVVVLHDGDPLRLAAGGDALVDLSLPGERHRIQPILDPSQAEAVNRVLGSSPAPVVADGHHRLTALDELADRVRPAMRQAMVLVVDVADSDVTVGTIHRVVRGLDLETVRGTPGMRVVDLAGGAEPDYLAGGPPGELRWVASDGPALVGLAMAARAVHDPRPGAAARLAAGAAALAEDTCVLHDRLLPGWGVTDGAVEYVHDWDRARGSARAAGAVAFRTRAPGLEQVLAGARAGHLLAPKATSITPKPRIGLLMLDGPG